MLVAAETSSRSRLKRFSTSSVVKMLTPVAFPPGRARLETSSELDGIAAGVEHDGDRCRRRLGGSRGGFAADRHNNCDLAANEVGGELRQPIVLALGPAILDRRVAALNETSVLQTPAEAGHKMRGRISQGRAEKPYHRHRRLLGARRARPEKVAAAPISITNSRRLIATLRSRQANGSRQISTIGGSWRQVQQSSASPKLQTSQNHPNRRTSQQIRCRAKIAANYLVTRK